MRDRAEIAHKTHNLKVVGLNPTLASKEITRLYISMVGFFILVIECDNLKKFLCIYSMIGISRCKLLI